MNILLDTCAFLWITTDAKELTKTAREIFSNSDNKTFLSCVSVWEIVIKNNLGKLPLPNNPKQFIIQQRNQHRIDPLELTEETIFHLQQLPKHHQDPFDRMLVCQAIEYDLVILTNDHLIKQYPIKTIW